MIQFEKKFFRYADEVSHYVKEMLGKGGSWDFRVEVEYDDEDKPSGYEVTADPVCNKWVKMESGVIEWDDNYKCYIPAGSEKDTVEGWEAECLAAFSEENNEVYEVYDGNKVDYMTPEMRARWLVCQ